MSHLLSKKARKKTQSSLFQSYFEKPCHVIIGPLQQHSQEKNSNEGKNKKFGLLTNPLLPNVILKKEIWFADKKKGRTQCRRLPALCGVWGRVVFKPQALPTQMCRGWGSNPGPSCYRRQALPLHQARPSFIINMWLPILLFPH